MGRKANSLLLLVLTLSGCATATAPRTALLSAAERVVSEEPVFPVGKVLRAGTLTVSPDVPDGRVVLELFPDARFTAVTTSVSREENGVTVWNASIEGARFFGAAMLAIGERGAFGTVQVDERLFAIRPTSGGATAVFELDPAAFPPEAEPTRVEDREAVQQPAGDEGAGPAAGTIDVMVVMAKPFSAVCSSQMVLSLLRSSIKSNLTQVWSAFTGSGAFTPGVKIVCNAYQPVGGDLTADLGFLQNDPSIAATRNTLKADLVTMLVPDADVCGYGNFNPSSSASSAFSVVKASCALDSYSLAHELGHNLGMDHDRFVVAGGGIADRCNYGFTILLNNKPIARTVMAYANLCPSCPRVGAYSTPVVPGPIKFGIPCSVKTTTILGSANNADQFVKAAPIVSKFR